ncbi:Carboxyl-terminal protease [Chitinispirillum alkaliphilum]|nr:Carboxyl-terminal protease [Chitinispirillum alkaliphilum]
MKKNYIFSALLILSCFAAVFQCVDLDLGLEKKRHSEQYLFSVYALHGLFLFREKLPDNFYAYQNPTELFASINEPFTHYYPPFYARILLRQLSTETAGVGVLIDSVETGFIIREVFKNSPAHMAGLKKKDTIVSINGSCIENYSLEEVNKRMRGKKGESVVLTVKREVELLTLSVVMASYLSPSVFVDSLTENTAYILLTAFYSNTIEKGGSAAEFRKALEEVSWAENLILDLRGNRGGELSQCEKIISELVPSGTIIAKRMERDYVEKHNEFTTFEYEWKTTSQGGNLPKRVCILQDTVTASASELLILALKNAEVESVSMGIPTYGKARGQALLFGPDTSIAMVTRMRFIPVTGEDYDNSLGIKPDYYIEEDVLNWALEYFENKALSKRNLSDLTSLELLRAQISQADKPPAAFEIGSGY